VFIVLRRIEGGDEALVSGYTITDKYKMEFIAKENYHSFIYLKLILALLLKPSFALRSGGKLKFSFFYVAVYEM
jgi:hypothetical protein